MPLCLMCQTSLLMFLCAGRYCACVPDATGVIASVCKIFLILSVSQMLLWLWLSNTIVVVCQELLWLSLCARCFCCCFCARCYVYCFRCWLCSCMLRCARWVQHSGMTIQNYIPMQAIRILLIVSGQQVSEATEIGRGYNAVLFGVEPFRGGGDWEPCPEFARKAQHMCIGPGCPKITPMLDPTPPHGYPELVLKTPLYEEGLKQSPNQA